MIIFFTVIMAVLAIVAIGLVLSRMNDPDETEHMPEHHIVQEDASRMRMELPRTSRMT